VADKVAVNMESQARMDQKKWKMFSYPASVLSEMRGGNSLYLNYNPRL
jgi:hypothetical protein